MIFSWTYPKWFLCLNWNSQNIPEASELTGVSIFSANFMSKLCVCKTDPRPVSKAICLHLLAPDQSNMLPGDWNEPMASRGNMSVVKHLISFHKLCRRIFYFLTREYHITNEKQTSKIKYYFMDKPYCSYAMRILTYKRFFSMSRSINNSFLCFTNLEITGWVQAQIGEGYG